MPDPKHRRRPLIPLPLAETEESWVQELRDSDRPRELVELLLAFIRGIADPYRGIGDRIKIPATADASIVGPSVIRSATEELATALHESVELARRQSDPLVRSIGQYVNEGMGGFTPDVPQAATELAGSVQRYLLGNTQDTLEAVHQAVAAWQQETEATAEALRASLVEATKQAATYATTVGTAETQGAYIGMVKQAVSSGGLEYIWRHAWPGACARCAAMAGKHSVDEPDAYYWHPHCACTLAKIKTSITDSGGPPMALTQKDREALLTKEGRSAFLLPDKLALPVHDEEHWRAARGRIASEKGLSEDERKALIHKWTEIGHEKGWLKPEPMTDAFETELEVIEDAEGKPLRMRMRLTRANVRNKNRRVYPREILEDMVARGQQRLKDGPVTMEWEHPPTKYDSRGRPVGFKEDPRRAVSTVDSLYMRGDRVYQDVTFLDTAMAQGVREKHRAGQPLYASLRSLGSTRAGRFNGEPTSIATFLDWHGGDWVPNPALPEAGPEAVLTDSEIEQALLDGAEEEYNVDELEKLKQQVAALTDAMTKRGEGDSDEIKALKKKIADLEAAAKKDEAEDKTNTEMKDAIAALTANFTAIKSVTDAAEAAKATEAAKAEVKAIADSIETNADLARFSPAMKKAIAERVGRAPNKESAQQALTDAVADHDRAIAAAQLAGAGFNAAAASTAVAGRTTTAEVVSNPAPHRAVLDRFDGAFREHIRLSNAPTPDASLRKANQPMIDALIADIEKKEGKALTDSAQAVLDGTITDSDTGNFFNQPTILLALLVQQFQTMEALQFVQGIGPSGFTQSPNGQGNIGSILRIPVEYWTAPTIGGASAVNLPYYDNGMAAAEGTAIPEMTIATNWLEFAPAWRRAAFTLTADAEKAMMHGPLNYDAWARSTYHLTQYKARTIDSALYEEMLQVSAEYGAVAVAAEAVAATEWTYAGGGSAGGYGANVVGVAQLLNGGVAGIPNLLVPTVRPRVTKTMSAAGQISSSTKNPITIPVINGVTQVLGYLDSDGQIKNIPGGGTATYAVDYYKGKVLFVAGSNVTAVLRPVVTYSYETNYDTFTVTNPVLPAGVTIEMYYNGLLRQLDGTAAGMGQKPRFMPPDLAIMSLVAANYIQNATTFYKWVSPEGSLLKDPRIVSNSKYAERNGIELAKINTPWSAADARIWVGRNGSTKYGVDVPFEMQGPHPKYDTTTGQVIDTKVAYGRENSVICTPQVQNQAGVVLNPVSRTIILR